MSETLNGQVPVFESLVSLQRQFIHGDDQTVVQTDNGPVPSIAKALKDGLSPAESSAAESAAIAQEAQRQYNLRNYPGTYDSDPVSRPSAFGGGAIQIGDSAQVLMSGAYVQKIFNGTVWYVPNQDGQALALSTGSFLVGNQQYKSGLEPLTAGEKMQESVSLLEFMGPLDRKDVLRGYSERDHTAAVQRAITSQLWVTTPSILLNVSHLTGWSDGSGLLGGGHIGGRGGVPIVRIGSRIRAIPKPDGTWPTRFIEMAPGRVRCIKFAGFTVVGDYVNNPTGHGAVFQAVVDGIDGGLWYPCFQDLFIRGFGGWQFGILGGYQNTNAPCQWPELNRVYFERPTADAKSLVLMGQVEHLNSTTGIFDGYSGLGPVGLGSYIGRYTEDPTFLTGHLSDINPSAWSFQNSTWQRAHTALLVDRCEAGSLGVPWFETIGDTAVRVKSSAKSIVIDTPTCRNVPYLLDGQGSTRGEIRSPDVQGTMTALTKGDTSGWTTSGSVSKDVATSGRHQTFSLSASGAISIGAQKFVAVKPTVAGLYIDDIQGAFLPGDVVTIQDVTIALALQTGGKISLGGYSSPIMLQPGETISFVKTDTAEIVAWRCVSLTKSMVKQIGYRPDSTATDVAGLRADMNLFFAAARNAGHMVTTPP